MQNTESYITSKFQFLNTGPVTDTYFYFKTCNIKQLQFLDFISL